LNQVITIIMKKLRNKFYGLILIFLLIISLFFPTRNWALEPKIMDILITNDVENVLLYARLVNGFKPEMEMAILAGISTNFTMWLEVYEERPLLWDKKITEQEIKRTIKYDNLKKTFSVSNNKKEPVIFSDFESAQKAMSDFNGIIATPMSSLKKGKSYYVLVKIKMDKVRLPLHMENVFLFVSLWDFETSWYRQNFTY
jgi:hypothetical protein